MPTTKVTLSVKVIIRNPQGQVLLLKRSAVCKGNPGKWEFPGGKMNAGEAFDAALIREVREETGLEVELHGSFGTCESVLADRRIVYLIIEAVVVASTVRLSTEHSDYQWTEPADFDEVDFAPHFRRLAQRYAREIAADPRPAPQSKSEDCFKDSVVNPRNLRKDLKRFRAQKWRLKKFSRFLKSFLLDNVKPVVPLADIAARQKDPASFAGKLIKKAKYTDPLRQVTDLVGARVIVHLASEVDAVCGWIERTFEIDRANSGDKLNELGADKFGYRSVHYVVEMRDGKPLGVPSDLIGLKAEIQVRTIAQHAWSDIGHDRVYKCDCEIPVYWRREANRIAALLEAVDEEFAHLTRGLAAYQDHVRQSPDDETARRHLALWQVVSMEMPKNPLAAQRVTRLALELEEWEEAVKVVDAFKGKPTAGLICAKGYALCKAAKSSNSSRWKQGIALLKKAANTGTAQIEPCLHLGRLLAEKNSHRALEWYERAFEIDSSNPSALAGYVRHKALAEHSLAFVPLLRPAIEEAIKRSEELAAAGADLPHAYYRIAGFLQLLGPEHSQSSLAMLARAVHQTPRKVRDPLIQALKDVSELIRHEKPRPDLECARRFLSAAVLTRYPYSSWPAREKKPVMRPLDVKHPVVIVAGGCDGPHEKLIQGYGLLLEKAFSGFRGTVISGGTTEGISGLVGSLAAKSEGRIKAVGYLPKRMPVDGTATKDERYQLRRTDLECAFTACEPIQSWLDLLCSGVNPKDVRLLGINGGKIAGLEYRLAVALGAYVGVLEGSGREAEVVVNDWPAVPLEESSGKLVVLPPDAMTLRAFIRVGILETDRLPMQAIEEAAKLSHQMFLEEQRYEHSDHAMHPWSKLRRDLRESNMDQITYLLAILRSNGFGVRPLSGAPNDPGFTSDEIRTMGEMEHGRWNVERLVAGWTRSPKRDAAKKLSPYLIPWEKLDPAIQRYDLKNVIYWPQVLADVGYDIYRLAWRELIRKR